METPGVAWEKPGPGSWVAMPDHFPGSVTPLYRELHQGAVEAGIATMFEKYGVPLRTMSERFVHGHVYARLAPLIMADKDMAKPPPPAALWLVTRLHPAFRARTKTARRVLAEKPWLAAAAQWESSQRAERERRNLALQDEDLPRLDDAGLADHYQRAVANLVEGHVLHFELHGPDLFPIGRLLVAAAEWGVPSGLVMDTLQGASPATAAPSMLLARLRELVVSSGAEPISLDDVRALSVEAASLLDEFLRLRGWHMTSRYDLDGRALGELPGMVLACVTSAAREAAGSTTAERAAAALERLLAAVPAGSRAEASQLVDEGRAAYGLRDENGPYNVTWPNGLVRRALLEMGRRLAAAGRIDHIDHVFELRAAEVIPLLLSGSGPSAPELAERAADRAWEASLAGPAVLGPPEVTPPTKPMPAAMRTVTEIASTAFLALGSSERTSPPLHGLGIGDRVYVGRACVARDPEEALSRLAFGDVLVTPMTTPAYNAVLPLAGAVVVEEGGPLCHAAVIARELDIPAVVGAASAVSLIADGDIVEVDPAAGVVRVSSTVVHDVVA